MLTNEERLELAALEALQDRAEPIEDYVARISPKLTPIPRHQISVLELFELSRHQEVYATITEPPRMGKTTAIQHGLAYRTTYDPACLNFYATFGNSLSNRTSRKVRQLVRRAGVPLSREAANVQEWETPGGGGLKATSVGGDVTGRGCNGGVIVADDLLKGRKFAENPNVREDTWNWFRDDLMSRLEPGASLFVNMTRWHEDDIIGRLHEDPLGLPWFHVEWAAVVDELGRATDERVNPNARALWPEGGYDLARLARIRMRGEHGWWSLYQGQPFPRGGGVFKRHWFTVIDSIPKGGRWVRSWDLAASTDRDAAFTCGVKIGLVDDQVIVADVRRGQWSPHERDKIILATAREDGHSVTVRLPQDPGQAGLSQKLHFARLLHGFTVVFQRESEDKGVRADPVVSQAEAGNVFLVRGDWNRPYLDEVEAFPARKLKDQVDATSGGYYELTRRIDDEPPVSADQFLARIGLDGKEPPGFGGDR